MNFFQSVFSDDPEPDPQSPQNPNPNPNIPSLSSAWQFSSTLLQTVASKSESVLQTYRHDLHEFTSGLKTETDVILEAGVDSLESVGQAIDNLGNTVTSILTFNDNVLIDNDDSNNNSNTSGHFSRVDVLIRNARHDAKTYLNDPEGLGEFSEWVKGFSIDAFKGVIEEVMDADGGVVREIFEEVVPGRVDEVTFWERYFYKVWKIRKLEEARVMLVKKAISGEEDEELSWDVDEDEYEEKEGGVSGVKKGDKEDESEMKTDVKVGSEGKTDRDSDISIVSTQPSREEDGWDEIEDIGSSDENKDKVVSRGSPDRTELRKRLSVAEDEEDLTWDIEDDEDEHVKA